MGRALVPYAADYSFKAAQFFPCLVLTVRLCFKFHTYTKTIGNVPVVLAVSYGGRSPPCEGRLTQALSNQIHL